MLSRTAFLILVAASAVLALSMGLRQSLGLFLSPMAADVGTTAIAFGLAMAVQNIVWGARPVVTLAALTYAAGLLLMATADNLATGLVVGAGWLVGLGVSGTAFGVVLGAAARAAPPERRS